MTSAVKFIIDSALSSFQLGTIMVNESGSGKLKQLFISVVGILIAGWLTLGELNFALYSLSASGTITNITRGTEYGRRGHKRQVQKVDYQFTDSQGKTYHSQDTLPVTWELPAGGQIAVQYIPGESIRSRIGRATNYIPIIGFAICAVWTGVVLFLIAREANSAPKSSSVTKSTKVAVL